MPVNTPPDLLSRLLSARSTAQVETIFATLPIVSPDDYQWVSTDDRSSSWQDGKLHWVPVGLDRMAPKFIPGPTAATPHSPEPKARSQKGGRPVRG